MSTLHPELVPTFDPALNSGKQASEVDARDSSIYVWSCGPDHSYAATIRDRRKGHGCSYCAGKKLLTGFNDLASREPELALDWHSRNGISAAQLVPGNTKRWWLCANGHEMESTVPNRRKTLGCSRCPKDERVLARANEGLRSVSGSAEVALDEG